MEETTPGTRASDLTEAAPTKPAAIEPPLSEASRRLTRARKGTTIRKSYTWKSPETRAACVARLGKARAENAARTGKLAPSARQQKLLQLRAAGVTIAECAKELDVTVGTITADLAQPQMKTDLAELRLTIRRTIMQEAANGLIGAAFAMARDKTYTGEAKDFDATMRGIHALEKLTQSASGEAQRVHVEHAGSTTPLVDLKVLIANVLGEVAST